MSALASISVRACAALSLLLALTIAPGAAAPVSHWPGIARQVSELLGNAVRVYEAKDTEKAKDFVNEAYFGPFEEGGMEVAIRQEISARRARELEKMFNEIRRAMGSGEGASRIRELSTISFSGPVPRSHSQVDVKSSFSSLVGSIIKRHSEAAYQALAEVAKRHRRPASTLWRESRLRSFAALRVGLLSAQDDETTKNVDSSLLFFIRLLHSFFQLMDPVPDLSGLFKRFSCDAFFQALVEVSQFNGPFHFTCRFCGYLPDMA